MGNIFEIRVKKTKNLGNYESKTVEAAMQLEDNEDVDLAMMELSAYVRSALNGVKPEHIKEVTDDGKVLTLNNKIKNAYTGDEVKKKEPVKKKSAPKKKKAVKEEAKNYTDSEVREGLQKVWKTKGSSIAKDILRSFKAEKISDLDKSQYTKVMVEVEKCLK